MYYSFDVAVISKFVLSAENVTAAGEPIRAFAELRSAAKSDEENSLQL